MTDAQLYLAVGLPAITALVGIAVNIGYFGNLSGRMVWIEDRLDNIMGALNDLDKRVVKVELKLGIQE